MYYYKPATGEAIVSPHRSRSRIDIDLELLVQVVLELVCVLDICTHMHQETVSRSNAEQIQRPRTYSWNRHRCTADSC